MEFSISWNNPDNKTESLSFTDQPQPSTAPVPIASIYGRRFYLQSSTCSLIEVINKVCQLQSLIFPNIDQFVEQLKADSPLKAQNVQVTSNYRAREFLKTTIPQIEMGRIANYTRLSQNPYFIANSVHDGKQHPLMLALGSKNHELLKQLCSDPHFLLINEKFLYTPLEGKQLSITPLEFAIISDDMEAFKIISEAQAFNRETPLPIEALKLLGPEKGNAFLEAYANMKPNLIDTSYYKNEFKELKKLGFSKEAIGKLKEYYEINVRKDSIPMIWFKACTMLVKDTQSDKFKKHYQAVLDLIHHPLTNLDAFIPLIKSDMAEECKTVLFYVIATIGGLKQHSEIVSDLKEKIPYAQQLLGELLKTGKYQLNDFVYAFLESYFSPDILEAIPKENLDAYKRNPFYMRTIKKKEITLINLARASRANLVTLLGKTEHTTAWSLLSANQAWQWRTKGKLHGEAGNDMEFFLLSLGIEIEKSNGALFKPLQTVQEGNRRLHKLTISQVLTESASYRLLKNSEENETVISDILFSINQGKGATYLPFRTANHTHALLFYQGHYITCDRRRLVNNEDELVDGARIKIYSYKNFLPEELLRRLLEGDEVSQLKLDTLHEEKNLDGTLLYEISLKPQKYENCPWASDIAPAIQVTHQLQTNPDLLLKEGKFDAEVRSEMHKFTHFAKKVAIQMYVQAHCASLTESAGLPDKELTGKALLYSLYKVAIKHPDPEYAAALDTLVYTGLAISPANVCMAEYAEADQERMKHCLEIRYALKGIKEYLMELGYDNLEKLSDAEAFLTYLTNDRPSNVVFPRYLLN